MRYSGDSLSYHRKAPERLNSKGGILEWTGTGSNFRVSSIGELLNALFL